MSFSCIVFHSIGLMHLSRVQIGYFPFTLLQYWETVLKMVVYALFLLNFQVLKILEGGRAILDSNSFGSRSGYMQGPNSNNHPVSKRHSRRLSY